MSWVLDPNLLMEAMRRGKGIHPASDPKKFARDRSHGELHGMGKKARVIHVIPTQEAVVRRRWHAIWRPLGSSLACMWTWT
jgi:hypothetical protein